MRTVGLLLAVTLQTGCADAETTRPAEEPPAGEAAEEKIEEAVRELAPNEALMTRADYGKDWPLTVDEGIVSCEGAGEVYFEAEGTTYAVNGLALGRYRGPQIDRIWAADPEIKGLKIDIGPIIDTGLELCE
ncbi:MAG TPA: DUF2511 domain-containing protein [Actinomycetota bacterium]|nr:DUF2511 domain-containing protein [Actinomycetota bacterium]